MSAIDLEQAIKALTVTQNILLLPSQPADGDSLGSALALYNVLSAQGKNVTVVITADVPEIYKFLPGADQISSDAKLYSDFVVTIDLKDTAVSNIDHKIEDGKINIVVTPEKGVLLPEQVSFPKPQRKYDLLVVLDAADLTQLGEFYIQNYSVFNEIPSLNIDHHKTNTNFASINVVDTNAASTTQILDTIFKTMNIEYSDDLATLLLTGLITDTSSFQNDNATPEAFDLAADLIDAGARQQEIIKHVYKTKQLHTLKLWGRILSKIQVDPVHKLVWSTANQLDFSETHTTTEDTGDIIDNLLTNAEEADTVLLLTEHNDGTLHGSIRTKAEHIDASEIAATFGGGGHKKAAGFILYDTNLEKSEQSILETVRSFSTPEERIDHLSREFVSKPQSE